MIAGAPKAGNVWLKHLLADLYDLPMIDVSGFVDPREALHHPRFVTHQHIRPRRDFLGWGSSEQVRFITMARHPGDLFLSLYHYVQNYGEAWRKAGILGSAPSHQLLGSPLNSREVMTYLAGPFFEECLGKTCQWLESERALFVRYEDLHSQGLDTLTRLTSQLMPTQPDKIAKAIEKHHFSRMKRFAGRKMKRHFRAGTVGDWSRHLDSDHLAAIEASHGSSLQVLGYDLDPQTVEEPIIAESKKKSWWQRIL